MNEKEKKNAKEREGSVEQDKSLANVLDISTDFTSFTTLVIDFFAYTVMLTALRIKQRQSSAEWLGSIKFIEKNFGARHPPVDGFSTTWEVAGKLPFTHCVMLKLLMTASKSVLVVPVNVNSVLSPRLRGLLEEESDKKGKSLNLYEVLTPLRVIASFDEGNAKRFPQAVFLGLHDADFKKQWHHSFKRIVKEAMSKNWPEERLSIFFIPKEEIRKTIENLSPDVLGWTGSQGDSDEMKTEKLALEKKILKLRQNQQCVLGKELVGQIESLDYYKRYLNQKNFISSPQCSITHKDKPVDPSTVWSLIDGRDIECVLLELNDHSELARKAFDTHGLIPAEVVKNILDGWGGHEKWLPVLSHYGIVILPAGIRCGHPEFDEVEEVGPRRNYRPASLPEPAQKNYIIPHLLPRKKLPTEDLGSYLRTEAFVIRHEGGHRISEGLFYFLVAILIKHYPQAPRCYHHAARLRVDKSGHILELKLKDDVLCASMLVKTSDKSFTSTGTAEVCSEVKQILKRDAKRLSESYLAKGLQFGALMTTHDQMDDFVSLDTGSFLSGTPMYSEEGEEFHPAKSLFLWFNCYGPKGSSLEKNFAKLSEEMDAKQVLDYLIDNEEITGGEYREVVHDKYPTLTARRLLMMIGERKKECDTLLYQALRHTGQDALADSIIRKSPEPGYIEASAIDTVQRKSPTAKSLLDVSTPGRHPEESKGQQSLFGGERKTPITHPSSDETADKFPFLPTNMISAGGMTAYSPTKTPSVALGRQINPLSRVLQQQTSSVGVTTPAVSREASHLPSSPSVPLAEPVPVKEDPKVKDPKVNAVFEAKYFHVERATDHFNERPFKGGGKRLGSGSFGTVYYGLLHAENGQKFEVAIKRLKKASSLNPAQIEMSRKQFGTEMFMLTRYLHENVVSLIGFSSDGPELCLVYEYMANGSLSHRLDCRDNTPPLQWKTRLPISRDVARGLDFLHSRYRLPVIHRDVKSSNVLLTSDFKAKLSDFGLAIAGGETGETSSGPAVGTRPYMPPEAFQKVLTTKVDVYGLGIIFYELATGLPPYSTKKKQDLKSYVDDIEQQGIDLTKMLDPKAKWPKAREGSWGVNLLEVAKQCTVKDYTKRAVVAQISPRLLVDNLIRKSGAR
eukprot:m.252116 g.252116  ORF g.252116 m.252116 type:complete len:1131 (+) comp40348_c0_seq1:689-4081(+)